MALSVLLNKGTAKHHHKIGLATRARSNPQETNHNGQGQLIHKNYGGKRVVQGGKCEPRKTISDNNIITFSYGHKI